MRAFPLFLLLCANVAQAAILVVDTTSDASLTACTVAPADCSLRGAITAAINAPGDDTINFNIPMTDAACVAATGVCTITPATGLPFIFGNVSAVTIDGYSQPGAVANTNTPDQGGLNTQLKIVLSASACFGCSGLALANVGSVVRGLDIAGFFTGVSVQAGGVVVEGNFIGTDVTGSTAAPNGRIGIELSGNPNGGGNTFGGARIGGVLPAQRNLVSGQSDSGMALIGFGIEVLGNLVGTNAAGTAAIANNNGIFGTGGNGVAFSYFIGDGTPAGRNVISGNSVNGILFGGPLLMHDSRIQGNYIGTDVSGELPLGNTQAGIEQRDTIPNGDTGRAVEIGGLIAGQGNRIQFNGGSGILVNPTNIQRTSILGNRLRANARLGISLGASAHLPNDIGDGDTGFGNNAQNFPEISASAVSGSNVNLSYRVDSATLASAYPLRVEFFKADGDEGRDFLGADDYATAQAQAIKAITLAVPVGVTLTANDVIVATATDANGNTSEFSFDTAALTIQTPEPSSCVTSDSVFCNGFESGAQPSLVVRVSARATTGPFRPNGLVRVTDNRSGSCTLALAPTSTALTSEGTCILVGSGAAGAIAITATLGTFTSAFASSTGGNVTTTANFILP